MNKKTFAKSTKILIESLKKNHSNYKGWLDSYSNYSVHQATKFEHLIDLDDSNKSEQFKEPHGLSWIKVGKGRDQFIGFQIVAPRHQNSLIIIQSLCFIEIIIWPIINISLRNEPSYWQCSNKVKEEPCSNVALHYRPTFHYQITSFVVASHEIQNYSTI